MRRALSLVAVAGLATAAFAWQQAVNQLQQDGKTISTNVRTVDGTLMVPVKDVASYLGGSLSVENGTATIGATKGGNPIGGAAYSGQGGILGGGTGLLQPMLSPTKRPDPKDVRVNVGEDADNDGFVLRVLGVQEIAKGDYRTQFDPRRKSVSPSLKDDKLVVVRMRVENRTSDTQRPTVPSGLDLTLFDAAGVGTPVRAFDARPVGSTDFALDTGLGQYDALEAPILQPKGSFEFAAVFSAPKDSIPTKLAVALPASGSDTGGANVIVALR